MKLYTLAKPFPVNDDRSCLNGKVFYLLIKDGIVYFLDLDEDCIWKTTDIVQQNSTGPELTIQTQNTVYQFVEVSSLLPTKAKDEPKDEEPVFIPPKPATIADFIKLFRSVSELADSDPSLLEEPEYPDGPRFFLLNRNRGESEAIDLIDELEYQASELLIGEYGSCNWDNIHLLMREGFNVYAGEKDSYGWLTGIVECKGKKLLYD